MKDEGRIRHAIQIREARSLATFIGIFGLIYEISNQLPKSEEYNLKSQLNRAATSISLNIAEGSTGQTNPEQARFLGLAIRSLLETVACQHIISRRNFLENPEPLRQAYRQTETLVAKLHAMRKAISPKKAWLREEEEAYSVMADEGQGR